MQTTIFRRKNKLNDAIDRIRYNKKQQSDLLQKIADSQQVERSIIWLNLKILSISRL